MLDFFTINEKLKSDWDSIYQQNKTSRNFKEAVLFNDLKAKSTAYNPANKTIYYASNLGLMYQSLNKKGELTYEHEQLFIKTLVCGDDKLFALASNGKMFEIDSKNKIKSFFPPSDNKDENIKKIALLDDNLLVYTRSAIDAYNFKTKKWLPFLRLGLDLEVYDCVTFENKLILATSKGVLVQDKISINTTQKYPQFIIDEFLVNDSLWNEKGIKKLKYYQNNIVIKYAQLAYAPNSRFPIFYRINNGKWQLLDAYADALKLMSLSPGSYLINFRLGNVQNQLQPAPITFEISKPIWQTNIFLASISLLFLTAVYAIYHYKITENNKRNQLQLDRVNLEKNLNQSKLKAIKSQMNPHFFYNALNTIQSYILANDKKQAVNYLSKFSILTRTILEMSEYEYIPLSEELKMMRTYLEIEKVRFDDDFDYEITIEGFNEEDTIKIPSMLLQPYLENAIKHGLLHKTGEKKLNVAFKKEKNTLVVIIDDNGIGREKSQQLNQIKNKQHKSFATTAINNRIELLNQNNTNKIIVQITDKKNISNYTTGTTVQVNIPLEE